MTVLKRLKESLKYDTKSWKYHEAPNSSYYLYKDKRDTFKITEEQSHMPLQKIAPFSINLENPIVNFRGKLILEHKSNIKFMPIRAHNKDITYITNYLDKYRFVIVYPSIIAYKVNGHNFFLNYYIKDSLRYLLANMISHTWITDTYNLPKKIMLKSFNNNILKFIPSFSSNNEKYKFISWLKRNYSNKKLTNMINIYIRQCNTKQIKLYYPHLKRFLPEAAEGNAFTRLCNNIYINKFPNNIN